MNREIIHWIASNSNSTKHSLNNQFILDSIVEVVFMHYRKRVSIYRFSKKLPWFNRKIFTLLSVIYLLFGLSGMVLREIRSMLYVYKGYSITDNKQVNLSLNFPLHSFSLTHKRKSGNCYSFGEYLTLNYPNITMLSIGEYVRGSEKINNRTIDNDVFKFQRYIK